MSTYDPKQVLADYAKGQITPEMAVGHSLQHIDKLYEAHAAVRSEMDALSKRANTQQTALDRLTAFMEKLLRKPKKPNASSQAKPDQS